MARKRTAAPATPTTITKMDAAACDVLRPVINEALKAALAPYGVTAIIGKMRYAETNVGVSLEIVTASNDEQQFKELVAFTPGLKAEWFGKTFVLKGKEYRVVGADSGRSKYPVKIQRVSDGQVANLTTDGLRNQLDKEAFNAECAVNFPKHLKTALELGIYGDYQVLKPYVTVLTVGMKMPQGYEGTLLGLAHDPYTAKPRKNFLAVDINGKTGFYSLLEVINALPKTAAA